MVGGLGGGGKGRRGYGAGGHLQRPQSVGDFNEMEEDGWSINQVSIFYESGRKLSGQVRA
jgi:hypothetical protein